MSAQQESAFNSVTFSTSEIEDVGTIDRLIDQEKDRGMETASDEEPSERTPSEGDRALSENDPMLSSVMYDVDDDPMM